MAENIAGNTSFLLNASKRAHPTLVEREGLVTTARRSNSARLTRPWETLGIEARTESVPLFLPFFSNRSAALK